MRIFVIVATLVFLGSFKSDASSTIREKQPEKNIILCNETEFLSEANPTNNQSSGQGIHCTMQIIDY